MKMEDVKIKQLIREGENFEKAGELENALKYYSRALDVLVEQAKNYAQIGGPGVLESIAGTAAISEQYLVKFNDYLKKDLVAAAISNSMGLIFAKMGNNESSKVFFEQAIDFTPVGIDYNDPFVGLEMIKNRG